MGVSPARRVAFEVLRRVDEEGAFAADLLHARLERAGRRPGGLKPEDAALATELTLGVLRWRRLLDFLLEQRLAPPAGKLDPEVRVALRLGLYQLRFLTRVPPRAAVNESVELVKRARKRSAAALVNAVLRRGPGAAPEALLPPHLGAAERLGILHSHPDWLVERWLARYGEAGTVALLEANNRAPRVCAAVHGPREEAASRLAREGLSVEPGRWLRNTLIVSGGNPTATRAFRRGLVWLQDEASQMVPLLLDVRPGQSVLDVCAAPGGKTWALARAAGAATVVAADRHLHRLRAMEPQLTRLRVGNVARVAVDATASLPFRRRFERILVDAPCSGTGTLARHPEIRWRLGAAALEDLQARQVALLRAATAQLEPGGRLVYATCSLEPEENERVIEQLLRSEGALRLVRADAALAPHLADPAAAGRLFDGAGFFRTFPPEHGVDGFFAAALEAGPA